MTLTVAISYGLRRSLIKDSIYTRKLTLRGESVPEALRADVHLARRAAEMMHPASPELLAQYAAGGGGASTAYVTVREDDSLWDVLASMEGSHASVAVVQAKVQAKAQAKDGPPAAAVLGAITQQDILDTLASDMELFNG